MATNKSKIKRDKPKRSVPIKDKFNFGSIFGEAYIDYKKNFPEIFKFMLIFFGIPSLIFALLEFACYAIDPNLLTIVSTPALLQQLNEGMIKLPFYFQIISLVFSLISICLMVFLSASLISTSIKKSKFSFHELIDNGRARYDKFFIFSLVTAIFIVLLFFFIIIPGIIFGIYWLFASYVFFDKKEKILPTLKKSREIVRGRWWKTFGYFLLTVLILGAFSLAVNIIQIPTIVIEAMHILRNTNLSIGFLGISSLITIIAKFFAGLVSIPFAILFFKNVYLKIRK